MQRLTINTEALHSVEACLEQLLVAEQIISGIKSQLAQPNNNKSWEHRARQALEKAKGKRRVINATLALLQHKQKQLSVTMQQRENDLLVAELKKHVPVRQFIDCQERVRTKLNEQAIALFNLVSISEEDKQEGRVFSRTELETHLEQIKHPSKIDF